MGTLQIVKIGRNQTKIILIRKILELHLSPESNSTTYSRCMEDYAIDTLKDQAIFSIFKKSNEMPQYTIHKLPKLKNSQKMYQVKGTDGKILKRGSELPLILRILDKDKNKYKVI